MYDFSEETGRGKSVGNGGSVSSDVFGSFEWLCDFEYLKPLFDSLITEQFSAQQTIRVLEVGCGTSTLAIDLQRAFSSQVCVHSIDNDANCINYMQELYKDEAALTWMVYDMIECPEVPNKAQQLATQSFDIIVDKGSLDAMLVEGCISSMLCEVYRLLKPNGVYFLCSLHPPQLLDPLLSLHPLCLEVKFPLQSTGTVHTHEISAMVASSNRQKNIALCTKKVNCSHLDMDTMINTENDVMKDFFQNENPFLTDEKKEELRRYYISKGSVPFCLSEAHTIIATGLCGVSLETPDCDLDYNFELFEEDLCDFELHNAQQMTLEELLLFISIKQ
jgi:ubiquinone/menaquinone biosynthesis C-methylase UbiE